MALCENQLEKAKIFVADSNKVQNAKVFKIID